MRSVNTAALVAMTVLIAACGDEPVTQHVLEGDGGHAWETQTSALEKARDVEGILAGAAEARRPD